MGNLNIQSSAGYQTFSIGGFTFTRDEYFANIYCPKGHHTIAIEDFLKALQRDVAWGFFYGTVSFDSVFGTVNHYGEVDMFSGSFSEELKNAGKDYMERFDSEELMTLFKSMLSDWTIDGFDPFAAPLETGRPYGEKDGDNDAAITRERVTAKRMVGMDDDAVVRSDENGYPVNRMFADVDQSQPQMNPEPGFESEVKAFNLFGYLSRSDVTWNPSVCSVLRESLFCPTSEEFKLPIEHGNDRVEWFIQLSDEIVWEIKDGQTSKPRALVTMKAGDVAAMPADIRHQGFSPKRSMLLVWENASPKIPALIREGKAPVTAVDFD